MKNEGKRCLTNLILGVLNVTVPKGAVSAFMEISLKDMT